MKLRLALIVAVATLAGGFADSRPALGWGCQPPPQPISYGSTVSGVICPAGQQDLWWFDARAGDQVRFIMRSDGSQLSPALELWDCCSGSGTKLTYSWENWPGVGAHLWYTIPTLGRYVIRAGSLYSNPQSYFSTGEYTLSFTGW